MTVPLLSKSIAVRNARRKQGLAQYADKTNKDRAAMLKKNKATSITVKQRSAKKA